MPNPLKIPTWADEGHVNAVVEPPRGTTCKLDFDPDLRVFTLAKSLMAGLTYPYDWGRVEIRHSRRGGAPAPRHRDDVYATPSLIPSAPQAT
jgi:inorganic pyrophosphatase